MVPENEGVALRRVLCSGPVDEVGQHERVGHVLLQERLHEDEAAAGDVVAPRP